MISVGYKWFEVDPLISSLYAGSYGLSYDSWSQAQRIVDVAGTSKGILI